MPRFFKKCWEKLCKAGFLPFGTNPYAPPSLRQMPFKASGARTFYGPTSIPRKCSQASFRESEGRWTPKEKSPT